MAEYTRFTNIQADAVKAAALTGLLTATVLTKSADYELADSEKTAYIGVTLSAASKKVTLGLKENQVAIVVNEGGSNTFTLKNVAGDSGTSLAAGKLAVVRASTTANASKVYVLN